MKIFSILLSWWDLIMSHTRTCITNGASTGLFAFVPMSVKILTDIFSGYFFLFEDSDGEYECPLSCDRKTKPSSSIRWTDSPLWCVLRPPSPRWGFSLATTVLAAAGRSMVHFTRRGIKKTLASLIHIISSATRFCPVRNTFLTLSSIDYDGFFYELRRKTFTRFNKWQPTISTTQLPKRISNTCIKK